MAQETLDKRVERLEMTVDGLAGLPERMTAVEGQILLLRDEMRGEFSAIRAEMKAQGEELRGEVRAHGETLKAHGETLKAQGATLKAQAVTLETQAVTLETQAVTLKTLGAKVETLSEEMHVLHQMTLVEIKNGDEGTRNYMRTLVEELRSDLRVLGEGRRKPRKRR